MRGTPPGSPASPAATVHGPRIRIQIAQMPPDDPRSPDQDAPRQDVPRQHAPREDAAAHEPTVDSTTAPDTSLPPLLPYHTAPHEERPLPRGCHPLVFGVVMATLQMAALFYFMPSCFGRPG